MPRVPTSRFVALSASAPWAAESMSCLPDWKSAAAGVTALQSSRHRWNDQAARRRFARLLRDRTALRFRGSFVTARVKIAAARAIRQSLAFLYTDLGVSTPARRSMVSRPRSPPVATLPPVSTACKNSRRRAAWATVTAAQRGLVERASKLRDRLRRHTETHALTKGHDVLGA